MMNASEMRMHRRDCMRRHLEEKMLEYADGHYLGYTTTTHHCPKWLRKELEELGYIVQIFGVDNKGVQILFGEEERE